MSARLFLTRVFFTEIVPDRGRYFQVLGVMFAYLVFYFVEEIHTSDRKEQSTYYPDHVSEASRVSAKTNNGDRSSLTPTDYLIGAL